MKSPNFVFIMADDHAVNAISAYGSSLINTKHIDRLASDGMCFTHCYTTNSLCAPSRAAILTGTYNHVNGVYTLKTKLSSMFPNFVKHLQRAGYSTGIIGKWHLGDDKSSEPSGFDHFDVLLGQGDYYDSAFNLNGKLTKSTGYVTDVITAKSVQWLETRDVSKPFFLMINHKAPHREWENHPKYDDEFRDNVRLPDTFNDNYDNRAKAAGAAKIRIREDLKYDDLGLVQPEGGVEVGQPIKPGSKERKIPDLKDSNIITLIDKKTGEKFEFSDPEHLAEFKYQRYIKRYLRTVLSLDESVGNILDYLDDMGLARDTVVVYTSDQGFFLGEHGWFDKRFIYEESFQMPLIIRYPEKINGGGVCSDIVSNVDFAPTLLDIAGLPSPSYMQGRSFLKLLMGKTPPNWEQIAYHRYWMHKDLQHNVYAHYGVRDRRYKLIYWYNEGLGIPGATDEAEPPEWEFFDCVEDPLELINCYGDSRYSDEVSRMRALLDAKMSEIGDVPRH